MYTIAKRFAFSASHVIGGLPADHPCARLHGHNYEVEVVLQSPGAPEAVLAASERVISDDREIAIDSDMQAEWLSRVGQLGHHGLRVLACAMKTGMHADVAPYENLTFVGLVALEGPARADVPHAIRDCQQAGIRVVMVTGDHAVRHLPRSAHRQAHGVMVFLGLW
jgi:P-type Ca2+ transporter type 2C